MNMTKRIRLILIVILGLIFAYPVWNFIRISSYTDTVKTIIMPNGRRVSVRLVEAKRVGYDKVKISMDFSWIRYVSKPPFEPDMAITITSPRGASGPFTAERDDILHDFEDDAQRGMEGSAHIGSDHIFVLNTDDNRIDISQSIYCRKPANRVMVELPLDVSSAKRISRQEGTARVELIDFGESVKYKSQDWEPHWDNSLPSDIFCVHVKQEDTDGPLVNWPVPSDSHAAELVDDHGKAVSITAEYVAKNDCDSLTTERDVTPWLARLGGFRRIESKTEYIPRNGEWLYTFKPKPNRKYVKIRIKYQLPPKPQDKVTVRFDRVPI